MDALRRYRQFQNTIMKLFPWTVILYAKRHYGYSWRTLIHAWRNSEAQPEDVILGIEHSRPVDFFSKLAEMQYDECTIYTCVFGCCWIEWHPRRGNLGGGGPAGCPCDDMKDPRDMSTGRATAELREGKNDD